MKDNMWTAALIIVSLAWFMIMLAIGIKNEDRRERIRQYEQNSEVR